MCGILGYFSEISHVEILKENIWKLKHRGPDAENIFFNGDIGFGFRRLSIIDLENGSQPMTSLCSGSVLVFNGEIYNYKDLRLTLKSKGHSFRTKSDSEVIIHAYEEWGLESFSHLDGMFAIAIWDSKNKSLVLARDPLGKKPLHFTILSDKTLWFSSEIKPLLDLQNSKKINITSLELYFLTDSTLGPETIIENIQRVPPGSYMLFRKDAMVRSETFWTPVIHNKNQTHDQVLNEYESLLNSSVNRRLQSDVPVGIFLSGGIDSTLIASKVSSIGATEFSSYTAKFDSPTYDESSFAKNNSKILGFNHNEINIQSRKGLEYLELIDKSIDEPINDPAIIPLLLLSKFAQSNNTKVILSGDGGDEIFFGYSTFTLHHMFRSYPLLPKVLNHVRFLKSYVKSSEKYMSTGLKIERLFKGLPYVNPYLSDISWRGAVFQDDLNRLLGRNSGVKTASEHYLEKINLILAELPDLDFEQKLSWIYLRTYLLNTVLVKVDRASMSQGVEVRSPLLDPHLIEFGLNLSSDYRTGKHKNKGLLKELIPSNIMKNIPRTKHGMGVPTASWLKNELFHVLMDYSDKTYLNNQSIFDPSMIRIWISEHRLGKDRRKELWGFLIFQLWYERNMAK